MKRKCYALLSLLLAVCMVLPMGVFVGAANTKDTIKIEVSGNIGSDGKVTTKSEDYTNGSINLAMDGTATVTVTVPSGYTVTAAGEGKGVTGITGNGTEYQIYAVSTRLGTSDKYTFTAKKAGSDTVLTATLGVNVVARDILDVKITADVDGKEQTLANNDSFNPGQQIVVKSVRFYYNDGTDSDINLAKVEPEKVTVAGGMKKLNFTVTDTSGLSKNVSYDIFVLGKEITSLDVTSVAKPIEYKDGETASLEANIVVRATYSDNKTVTLDSNDYTITLYAGDKEVSTDITKDNYKDLSFKITYDGFTTDTPYSVAKFITYTNAKPADLTMTFGKNAKKDWVEGQTLNNFNDVTVTIFYDDGTSVPYSNNDAAKLNLSISKFVYGDNFINVDYTEGGKTISKKVSISGLTVSKKLVEDLQITKKPSKGDYTEGDKLVLDGMEISLIYNNGETEALPYSYSKFSCSPANGSILSAGTVTVYVIYKDSYTDANGKTQSVEKTVNMSLNVKKAGVKATSASLTYGYTGKTEYFVGDTFKPDNFRVDFVYNNGTVKKAVVLTKDMIKSYQFGGTEYKTLTAFQTPMTGTMTLTLLYNGDTVTLDITITVTKRQNLKSITANFIKKNDENRYVDGYYVGDVPSVLDFNYEVKYDGGASSSFTVSENDAGYKSNTPYSYYKSEDVVYSTLKISPTRIEEDTKTLRITYTEKVTLNGKTTTDTIYTDVEIKVTVPDCILTHYESRSSRKFTTIPYESLYDALHDASDYDEIQLCRDVTLATDYDSSKTLEIDLNGHTLTMVRGEIYVRSNASSNVKITFSNSSRDDAHIRYTTKEDEDIIIAYNKEYVIDRSSKNDGRYDITITSVKNGKVTGPSEVIHGHDAKFTITPDEGYEIAAIKVNNKTYKAASDNTLLIEDVREKLTVTVTFQEKAWQNPFTDVSKYATYYKAVQFVYEEGLFNGTSATKFEPDTTMTRAMFVTVLGRLAGVNVDNYKTSSFSDVATGQWYSEYVEWASSIGLVEGYGNGKFGPNDSITHAQMYVLMERYADIIEGKNTTASGTSISANDVRDIPDWAYEAVEYAAKNDFLVVSSYKLTPNDNAKRSELAMLLQKFCKNILGY